MAKEDGGSAFPQPITSDNASGIWMSCENGKEFAGMTLRDYFAAKAMHGYLASWSANHAPVLDCAEGLAKHSYLIADAMLSERSK